MDSSLPIYEALPELKSKLVSHNTLILQAPPGAGKSTVLPLELLQEKWLKGQKIIMLEPRRLAARSVATRLASLYGEAVGETVGYRVRFENKTSKNTRIEVLTEGILTRMIQQDNSLENVGLVIFDEFHERSLHADLALALCRESQQVLREDLRILIMSATLDGEKLSSLLGTAPIVTSEGRQYPIQINYLGNDDSVPMWQRMVIAIKKVLREHEGDILCFLPGTGEILRTAELMEKEISYAQAIVLPLYGDLSQQEQQKALVPDPSHKRKIVLATSIAETSLTIEGVKIVVDSGLSRVPLYDSRSGLSRLETVRVTQDAADQRAGRAGRLGPGVCYRLWSEGTQQQLIPHRTPEILEADLAPMLLELASWGVQEPSTLTWLTQPPVSAIKQATEVLETLDSVKHGKITSQGKEILALPTHPRIAHLLLEAKNKGWLGLATDVAAILEERDPLPKETGANLALRVEALRKWRKKESVKAERGILERIERLAVSWRKIFKIEADTSQPNYEQIGFLIASAFPERVAKQKENDIQRYRLATGRIAKLPDHDDLDREEWLAISQLDAGGKEGKIFLAAPVNIKDLEPLLKERRTVAWDSQKGQLVTRKELCFGEMTVSSSPLDQVPEEERVAILCKAVQQEGVSLLPWTESLSEWQARLACVRGWRPEEEWPDVSTEHLLASVEEWLAPYLLSVRKREDFKKLDIESLVKGSLPWDLSQRLEKIAPEKLTVPSGFDIPLQYFNDGRDPVLSVRLQEMYGLLDTPTVNQGKTKVLLHLLSPGYKPVQVTQDLKSFWQNIYPEVRKELRVRYQKHSWPEDPWSAQAVRGVKKRT